jgi:hypothetical protein
MEDNRADGATEREPMERESERARERERERERGRERGPGWNTTKSEAVTNEICILEFN